MVNIPSDLRKNKEKIIGNMDLRECICLFIGMIFAILVLYYIKIFMGYKNTFIAAFISGLFLIPFLILGFKQINGMKIDDYIKVFINNKIISNSKRINILECEEPKISNKKYELIRYYRLTNKEELIKLRQYLLDKNILILTEYIDYKGDFIVIFRIDGKNMILEQMRRNKETIINIKNNKSNKGKSEIKYLKSKTINDIKDEINIFENVSDINAERIQINQNSKIKKYNVQDYDYIKNLRKILNEDERNIYELNLFNKSDLRNFIKNVDDKIIFINNGNEVDVYMFGCNESEELIDLLEIDKKQDLYKKTILGLYGKNFYNHYRKINDLLEII